LIIYEYLLFFLVDICKNHQNLTDAKRKFNYETGASPKCDDTLNGWYRFQGAAGTKMVTTCPEMYRCGANFPAWLSGVHPTVAEGKVPRTVCIRVHQVHCQKGVPIEVKNCGSYYIYNLKKLDDTCDARYCGTD